MNSNLTIEKMYTKWGKLPAPNKNEYSSFNLRHNLYITKNFKNLFGIIFSDTRTTINMKYSYLEIDYKHSLSGKNSNL